jgi:hypothetical protein
VSYRKILEQFAENFAKRDDEGDWWGQDTHLGKCEAAFRTATAAINRVKRGQIPAKYHDVESATRAKLRRRAARIWDEPPAWWKGSVAEDELMRHIASIIPLPPQPPDPGNKDKKGK